MGARLAMDASRVLENLRVRAGEGAAGRTGEVDVAAMYDIHAPSLYRYLVTMLGQVSDAEDALQEVFLGVMRRRVLRGIRDPKAYLWRAARSQALLVLRRRRRRDRERAAAALTWIDPDGGTPDVRELALDVDRALRQLPLEQREVMALRLGEDLTFREIAEVLAIPQNTVSSRYRRGLARLRALLEEGDSDDR
jgi:RNA polymerase sigma-70 factor (ECF subfamily)